ncbi:MAG: hypothetical protein ACP5J5_06970 [Dissulfurimicrobium sp.]|uniref:hypothetical protein n=1 Tax=Dissulfurimicrobium hydrothermale TaxID=1750598 RepID=UPI003C732BD5
MSVDDSTGRFVMDVTQGRMRGECLGGRLVFLAGGCGLPEGFASGVSAKVWIRGNKKEEDIIFIVNKITVSDPGATQLGQDSTGVRLRLMGPCRRGAGPHGRRGGGTDGGVGCRGVNRR